MTGKINLSVVVPSFNESGSLPTTVNSLYSELKLVNKAIDKIEIIIVNDGSSDATRETVRKLMKNVPNKFALKYTPLTRNFGKEAAVVAGFTQCSGDLIACVDADGQHPSADLKTMTNALIGNKEIDLVIGVRANNNHKKSGFLSKYYYKLSASLGNSRVIVNGTDFRVMRRHVIDAFLRLDEKDRINRDLIDWLHYPYTTHEFKAAERTSGEPTYGTRKLIKLAIDGAISSGTKPLTVLLPMGLITTLLSAILVTFLLFNEWLLSDRLNLNISPQGYALLIIIFFFGFVLTSIGIIALYLSRIFNEVRSRPLYVIDITNMSEK